MTRLSIAGAGASLRLVPWCLFLFLLPFERLIMGFRLWLPYNLLGVGAALLLALAPHHAGAQARLQSLAVAFLTMVLSLSYFFSLDPDASMRMLVLVAFHWLTYALASLASLSPGEFENSLKALMWGGACAALAAITAATMGQIGDFDGLERPTLVVAGVQTDPNFFAAGLLIPYAIALFHARKRPWWGLALAVLIGAGVLLPQSRGGAIGLVVVTFASLLMARRWKAALFLGGALPALYLTCSAALGRFDLLSDTSGAGRTQVWQALLAKGLDHWATGIGLGASPRVTWSAAGLFEALEPHSLYLEAFVEAGILGGVALLVVLTTHLWGRQGHPLVGPVRAGLLGLFASAFFLHFLPFKLMWVAWILGSHLTSMRAREATPSEALVKDLDPPVPSYPQR
ncbi:MAG TPA: O-antigen ligase family protein [Pantanalinema sp.]